MSDEKNQLAIQQTYDVEPLRDKENSIDMVSTNGVLIKLNMETMYGIFASNKRGNATNPTHSDVLAFTRACLKYTADPYMGEIWPVFLQGKWIAIVSAQTKLRRARACKDYRGLKQGWITNDGKRHPASIETKALPQDIIGVWTEFYREGSESLYDECFLAESVKEKSDSWKRLPLTMLKKVGRDQGCRIMYPELFDGMYTENEAEQIPRPLDAPDCETLKRGDRVQVENTAYDQEKVVEVETTQAPEIPMPEQVLGLSTWFIEKAGLDPTTEIAGNLWIQFVTFVLSCKKEDIAKSEDWNADMIATVTKALNAPLPEPILAMIPKPEPEKTVDSKPKTKGKAKNTQSEIPFGGEE